MPASVAASCWPSGRRLVVAVVVVLFVVVAIVSGHGAGEEHHCKHQHPRADEVFTRVILKCPLSLSRVCMVGVLRVRARASTKLV